jgi:F0F1-type ATP synthase membrane subunit b/b'
MIPQLDTTYLISSIIWVILCFFICFLFTYFYLLPKIRLISAKRAAVINAKIAGINKIREDIKKLEEDYIAKMSQEKTMLKNQAEEKILNFTSDATTRLRKHELDCERQVSLASNEISSKLEIILQQKQHVISCIKTKILKDFNK